MSPRKKPADTVGATTKSQDPRPEDRVEVRIGIQNSPREVAFQSNSEPDEIAELIAGAWAANEMVTLEDSHGSRILVPTDKIAYVELGPPAKPRVGFGAL